jgi:CRISPR-associated protein (TIGR03986 family)
MSNVLFLYNLDRRIEKKEIEKLFSDFGDIKFMFLGRRGTGFVEFKSRDSLNRAAEKSHIESTTGRTINVKSALRGIIRCDRKNTGIFYVTWRDTNSGTYMQFKLFKDQSVPELNEGDVVDFDFVRSVREKEPYKPRFLKLILKHSDYERNFVNPYNFVRVERPHPEERKPFSNDHTRYHPGCYSGKIHCRLKNISPLFIPDTETRTEDKECPDHWHYSFLRDNRSNPTLPATTLKGMFRSVFETLSNSCFSNINELEEKINYRGPAVKDLVPALVLKMPKKNSNGEVLICEEAWVDRYFFPDQDGRRYPRVKENANIEVLDFKLKNGYNLRFDIEKLNHTGRNGFDFNHACKLGKGTKKGFLKITGKKKTSYKHDERVFYHNVFNRPEFSNIKRSSDAARELMRSKAYQNVKDDILEFTQDEMNRYESVFRTQTKTRVAHIRRKNESFKDGTVYYNKDGLAVGDLIYVVRKGNTAENLSYVNIPKRTFRQNVHSLLEEYSTHLLPCKRVESLCPACNLFGAAQLTLKPEKGSKQNVSLAGKIRISNAKSTKEGSIGFEWVTLKILGGPHESATNFYLIDNEYRNKITIDKEEKKGYDFIDKGNRPIIRGRKYYWHQCDKNNPLPLHRYSYVNPESSDKTNQNSTVEVLKEGAEFEFDVYFENLNKDELSILIYCLELEQDLYHLIGHGKPLGLGTIEINIDSDGSKIMDYESIRRYYLDIGTHETDTAETESLDEFRNHFSSITVAGKPIKETMNYQDLKQILTPHPKIYEKIKYPSAVLLTGQHTGESFGFGWFGRFEQEQLFTIQEVLKEQEQTHYSESIIESLCQQ